MKRVIMCIAMAALSGCTPINQPYLIAMPDGAEAYSIKANSGPFMAGRMSERDVLHEYMETRQDICPNGYDASNIRRKFPENPSIIIIDAVVKCR